MLIKNIFKGLKIILHLNILLKKIYYKILIN